MSTSAHPSPRPTIAFLGPSGTFTEAAMLEFAAVLSPPLADAPMSSHPGSGAVDAVAVDSPAQAIAAVRQQRADYACVAIESSVDGAVTPTFDALGGGDPVYIYRELELPIAFSILAREGVAAPEVRTFSSHPVAYQQVKGWVEEHLGEVEFLPASSNAAAAEAVAQGRVDAAASPARAGQLWGLSNLADGVADVAGATTRFVLVGPPGTPSPRSGNDRSSVVFELPNEPGSLVGALQEFSHRGVDLSRIESRPTRRGMGSYRFHVDLVGHVEDQPVAEALRALWLRAERVRYLGSWPAAGSHRGVSADPHRLQQASDWVARLREGK